MASDTRSETRLRETFDSLTQARLDRAYRLAAAILGDSVEAEDAVQETAIAAWRGWPELRDPSRFDAWFDRILINRCKDHLRGRLKPNLRLEHWPPGAMAEPSSSRSGDEALLSAIATLSPDHRTTVVLRFVEDMELADIAARTGTRIGTVKSRLHYALRELRAAYDAAQRIEERHDR